MAPVDDDPSTAALKRWSPPADWELPSWNPHEWVPFNAALARIKDSAGSFHLAACDLYEYVLAGQMMSAVRIETRGRLRQYVFKDLASWRGLKIVSSMLNPEHARVLAATKDGRYLAGGSWYFFVRRIDLDRTLSAPTSKLVSQQEWLTAYLTPQNKNKLANYKNITEASNAIAGLMAGDRTIDGGAYKPRYIEKLLRAEKIFPPVSRR